MAGEIPVEETLVAVVLPPEVASAAADAGKPFAPSRPQAPQVFGSEDTDVKPPVILDQQMPTWIAPAGLREFDVPRHTGDPRQ